MKSKLHILLLLTLMGLFTACGSDKADVHPLQQAETLIAHYPDSVKAYERLLRRAVAQGEAQHDWRTASRALLLLAAQVQWTNEVEALALAYQALELHDRGAKDAKGRLQIQLAIANYLQQTDDIARARTLYNQCMHTAERLGLNDSRNLALGHLAQLSLVDNRPQEALALAQQMRLSGSTDSQMEPLFILANYYMQCNLLDQARQVYEQFDTCQNAKTRYVALRHLTEIAMLQADFPKASSTMDSAFSCAEVVFFQAMKQKDDYFRTTLAQEREAEHLKAQRQQTLWLLLFVLVVGVFLAVITFIVSRHRRAIQQQRLAAEQHEREVAEQRLEQQDTMIHILQNFIIEKSEVIQRLRAEGDEKKQLSADDWQDMEQTLDSITDGWVGRLRAQHPDFREEDIQLCMLTRMKLTNQTIADLYFITPSAVKHRKLKLKKEGFGEANPDVKLHDVLARLPLLLLCLLMPHGLRAQQMQTLWQPTPLLEQSQGVHVTNAEWDSRHTRVAFRVAHADAATFTLRPTICLSDEDGTLHPCVEARGLRLGVPTAVPADSALTFTLVFDALPPLTRLFDIIEDTVPQARRWMGIHSALRAARFPVMRGRPSAADTIRASARPIIRRFGLQALLDSADPDSVYRQLQPQLPVYRDYVAWKWRLTPAEVYELMSRPATVAQPAAGGAAKPSQFRPLSRPASDTSTPPAAAAPSKPRKTSFFSRLFGRKQKAKPMSRFEQKMLQEQRKY